ncbi:MAG: hypothetical protein IJX96_02190 [Clostridia bacterium]|nr:hypothetical protein [Clostridia bacterium]
MIRKAKWIWLDKRNEADEYATFMRTFSFKGGAARLQVCAETNYLAYVNGKAVAFGQFAGYKTEKYYDTVDIAPYCKTGENELKLTVWYEGYNSFTHIEDGAGAIFAIIADGEPAVYSDANVKGGVDGGYAQGKKELLTVQIGYKSGMLAEGKIARYPVKEVQKTCVLKPRPVKRPICGDLVEGILIDSKKRVYDLGSEQAGYLYIDIDCESEGEVIAAYGEYLENGEVNRFLPGGYKNLGRDFSFTFGCKKGNNRFTNYFVRLAGRYLQVFAPAGATVNRIGVIPYYYPVTEKAIPLQGLDKQIYETCVKTLRLCMHEHYEDCPWREQALYALDSRNQMLCGYYAFEEHEFQRANLAFIAKGVRADGLLELTYPAVDTPAIPFFSLVYPVAVYEYIAHTEDTSLAAEVYPTVRGIMDVFLSKVEKNGLIKNFPAPYWNFYEWTKGSDGDGELIEGSERTEKYELILNCAFVWAYEAYRRIAEIAGKSVDFQVEKVKKAIKATFFDEEKQLYYLSTVGEKIYSQLGNAFAALIGLGNSTIATALKEKNALVPATLSMLGFVYDALLQADETNGEWILQDIREKYSYMLDKGATTVWETLGGIEESRSNSLCHGWSAMPVYYYNVIRKK